MPEAIPPVTSNVNNLESLKETKEAQKDDATNNQESGNKEGLAVEVANLDTKISQMRSDKSPEPQKQANDQNQETPIE